MSRTDLADPDQEIRDIEHETQDNIDRGMPPDERRDAALASSATSRG